jgi:hypothetical protein
LLGHPTRSWSKLLPVQIAKSVLEQQTMYTNLEDMHRLQSMRMSLRTPLDDSTSDISEASAVAVESGFDDTSVLEYEDVS